MLSKHLEITVAPEEDEVGKEPLRNIISALSDPEYVRLQKYNNRVHKKNMDAIQIFYCPKLFMTSAVKQHFISIINFLIVYCFFR